MDERRRRADRSTQVLLFSGSAVALLLGVAATLALRRFFRSLDATYTAAGQAQAESARRAEQANRMKDEDRAHALEAGYDMHVAKPVDPDELASAVKTLVSDPARA